MLLVGSIVLAVVVVVVVNGSRAGFVRAKDIPSALPRCVGAARAKTAGTHDGNDGEVRNGRPAAFELHE
jgi:hypothetical protein